MKNKISRTAMGLVKNFALIQSAAFLAHSMASAGVSHPGKIIKMLSVSPPVTMGLSFPPCDSESGNS